MTSLPPSACCAKNVLHEGTPRGTMELIGNIPVYFIRPMKPNGNAIIIFPDIFGPVYKNIQLVADAFADNGYVTVAPDLLDGDAFSPINYDPEKIDWNEWLSRHNDEVIDPVIESVVKHLKESPKIDKIAGVGYCFGAKYVIRNMTREGGLDAGFIAHPSLVTSEALRAITKPLSIAAAEIDPVFTNEKRYESERILAELKIPYQINLSGSVSHGFALKADLSVKEVKYAADGAFEQALTWFEHWL